jgi:hypothetical protein
LSESRFEAFASDEPSLGVFVDIKLAADALVARHIRFVFVTGYGDQGLPAYRDRLTLRKPFQIDAPKRALQERLGTVVTSGLPRVGTARRERGAGTSGRLRPFAYGQFVVCPAVTIGADHQSDLQCRCECR